MQSDTWLVAQSPVSSARLLPRWVSKPQVRVALLVLIASISVQLYFSHFGRPAQVTAEWHQHLGGEYFNIARALVDGRGFADPFGEATGPTAWMPPLYPALLAALLAMTRSRLVVAAIILGLTHASFTVIGVTVYSIARRYARRAPPILVVALLALWLTAFNIWIFMITQDVWILALAVNGILLLLYRYYEYGEAKIWAWTVVGGALLLLSPSLSVSWMALLGFLALRDKQWRKWGTILAMVVAIGAPWTIRNAVVFHHFVPTKSNLFYDAYLANVIDEDGVYDRTVLLRHPYSNALPRFEYARLGEFEFNRHYGHLTYDYLRHRASSVLKKVANRAAAATVYYRPITIDERGGELMLSRIVYCLPVLAFVILGLLSSRYRKLVDAFCLFCAMYLGPYVLIAFYARYWLVLTPIFLLVTFLAIDTVLSRIGAGVTTSAVDGAGS
jgi:hypothetical protein